MSIECYDHKCKYHENKGPFCGLDICKRQEIIKKIEDNDPEILGALADIIIATMEEVDYKVKICDVKTLNKKIRERFKK